VTERPQAAIYGLRTNSGSLAMFTAIVVNERPLATLTDIAFSRDNSSWTSRQTFICSACDHTIDRLVDANGNPVEYPDRSAAQSP
jgi:hypothetical protein